MNAPPVELLNTLRPLSVPDQDAAHAWIMAHGRAGVYERLCNTVSRCGAIGALIEIVPQTTLDIELRLWAALAYRCERELRGCN